MQHDDLLKFKSWLTKNGADIVPALEREELRFRHGRYTGVVQKTKKGGLFLQHVAAELYDAFTNQRQMPTKPPCKSNKIDQLLERDGTNCFYCDEPLDDDITREHLLAQSHGGTADLPNLALAHKLCNAESGNRSIVEKVKLRDERRGAQHAAPVNVYGFDSKQ